MAPHNEVEGQAWGGMYNILEGGSKDCHNKSNRRNRCQSNNSLIKQGWMQKSKEFLQIDRLHMLFWLGKMMIFEQISCV